MLNWVVAKIRWILLATGMSTCAMLYAAVRPDEAVDLMFDLTLESPLAQIFVQGWAASAWIVGMLMLYGAYAHHARVLSMTVASTGKLVFLGLMLAYGRQYLDQWVSAVLAVEAVTVALFGTYAVGVFRWRRGVGAPRPAAPPRQGERAERPAIPADADADAVQAPVPTQPRMIVAAGKRMGPTRR